MTAKINAWAKDAPRRKLIRKAPAGVSREGAFFVGFPVVTGIPKTDEEYIFSGPRSREEAIRLLEEKISKSSKFVFAAVKGDYGEKLIASLDQIVLIDVPKVMGS